MPQVHLRLADAYMRRGQPEYALDVCCAGAALAPSSPSLWLGAGRAYMEMGDMGERANTVIRICRLRMTVPG